MATDGLGLLGFIIVDLIHLRVDVRLHVVAIVATDPLHQARDDVLVVLLCILEPEGVSDADTDHEQDDIFQHTLATRRGRGR